MSQGEFESRKDTRFDSDTKEDLDGSLLEEVVRETIAGAGRPLEAAELEALRDVVRRHRTSPMVLEPVAIDLVASVLRLRFPHYDDGHTNWRTMAESIASAIYDTPQTRSRLESFWTHLRESTT